MLDLVQICDDLVTLTQRLSRAGSPDTDEAIEVIDSNLDRVKTGKYDKLVKDQLTETKARIIDETSRKKFDPAALRSQMRTQSAQWTALRDSVASATRTAKSIEEYVHVAQAVPRTVPKNKSHITVRHPVVFTNKHVISKESLKRLPEKYEAVTYGSGYMFKNQLIVAFPDQGGEKQSSQFAKDLVEVINSEANGPVRYVPSFSDRDRTPYFSVPGSKLVYLWLVPQKIANFIKLDVRSVMLPDSETDAPEPKAVDPRSQHDKLKELRTKFEELVKKDPALIRLREEEQRTRALSRPLNSVLTRIKDRTAILRTQFMEKNGGK